MKEITTILQAQFDKMCATGKLFRASVDGNAIWQLYLSSFVQDPIFRDPASTAHTCNLCNNFIRRYGNIVALDENFNLMTIFDIEVEGEYLPVVKNLSFQIKGAAIKSVFFESHLELATLNYEPQTKNREVYRLGIAKNVKRYAQAEADLYPGTVTANEVISFHHLHLDLPHRFVIKNNESIESLNAKYTSAKEVFQRGMQEIPLDTLQLVRDLILQGSLLDGTPHLSKVERMIELKVEYDSLNGKFNMDNWCWATTYNLPIAKFRNELIGTLCVELAEGVELNKACQTWNQRVDPVNYMKVKSPITQRQIDEAMKFTVDNDYVDSFNRRLATLDDINVSEILHSNIGTGEIKNVTIFDKLKPTASTRHKRSEFEGVEEIHIDKFMTDILPTCTSVEAFLTNVHEGYMVNLTTPINKESKPIFKWDNNYSWTFSGNLAGKSQIKEAVKLAGGKVDGVLNFRLAWNDSDKTDNSDLDAWASEPNGTKIGFSTDYRKDRGRNGNDRTPYSGQLDVDNTSPNGKMAVENITWKDKSKMANGVYKVWVHQYRAHNSQGFKAEIEVDGETYLYSYDQSVNGSIQVAEITLANGEFSVKHLLPEMGNSSREIYNLETNKFHKVNLVCLSPNHWGKNQVGNKHYLFMLEECHTKNKIRTFHNENLKADLLEHHRKVMDVLGNQCSTSGDNKQLAGLGFNATVRDELIVRLSGSHKRVVRLKF